MKVVVKNVHTKKQYEEKALNLYEEAEDYVLTKYNAIYAIKKEID